MDINFTKNSTIGLPGQLKPAANPILEISLLVVVCFLLTWFVILPKKAQIEERKTQLAAAQAEEAQVAGKLNKLKELVQSLQSHKEQVGYLDKALPLDGKVLQLRFLLQDLADSSGVTVGNIEVTSKNGLSS